jgi:hypothetical protein
MPKGELQASNQSAQAATVIGAQPAALQLRYQQTLTEIAVEKSSTIIFPPLIDLIEPMMDLLHHKYATAVHEQPGSGTMRCPRRALFMWPGAERHHVSTAI